MNGSNRDVLRRFKGRVRLAVVLGSGLSSIDTIFDPQAVVRYEDIPGFANPSVAGHPGLLTLAGGVGGVVAVLAGRLHFYESGDPDEAASSVRMASMLGCRSVVLTQAAGALKSGIIPGTWLLPSDIVSFPARGIPGKGLGGHSAGSKLPHLIDPRLGSSIRAAALRAAVPLRNAVVYWTTGPAYETPAEARAAVEMGADAATMSPVPELLVARRLGIAAACLTLVTNEAPNVSGGGTDHETVLKNAKKGAEALPDLVRELAAGEVGKA